MSGGRLTVIVRRTVARELSVPSGASAGASSGASAGASARARGEQPTQGGEMVGRLVECDGADAGRSHGLAVGTYVIGRGRGADIAVRDADVSREHARLVVGAQKVVVHDAGSKNGVLVDTVRVDGQCEIEDGAKIRIGGLELELEHAASRVRRALNAAGEVTITRIRAEPPRRAPASTRVPLILSVALGLVVLALIAWGS